jgi:hypothetical protein
MNKAMIVSMCMFTSTCFIYILQLSFILNKNVRMCGRVVYRYFVYENIVIGIFMVVVSIYVFKQFDRCIRDRGTTIFTLWLNLHKHLKSQKGKKCFRILYEHLYLEYYTAELFSQVWEAALPLILGKNCTVFG